MDTKFHFLTGDVNWQIYGGKWYRKVGDYTYHVIELVNMWDATGDENQDQYNVSLQEIDLTECNLQAALSSYGYNSYNDIPGNSPENKKLLMVECVSSYGQYAPMSNWNGNNYSKLLKQAKQESYSLNDYDYHETQMERPVNQLGSTAYEYMQGDTISAMIRGIVNHDKNAEICGKIYGLSVEDIKSIQNEN